MAGVKRGAALSSYDPLLEEEEEEEQVDVRVQGSSEEEEDEEEEEGEGIAAAFLMLAPAILAEKKGGGGHGGGGGPSAGSAMATLSVTIIGAGVMALPNVFKTLGIVPATLALLFVTALTWLSLTLLIRATHTCGQMSFGGVIEASCGRRAALASQIAVIVNNMGELVVFLIIIGDVLVGPAAAAGHAHDYDEPGVLEPMGSPFTQKWFAIGLAVLCVHAPLCLLRRVEALSFTSTLSIGLSALFVTITFSLVLYRLGRGSIRGVEWVPLPETKPSNLLEMLPVLMILYVCHYNVHPIFAGMRRPTEKRMRRVVKTSLVFTTGVYWLIGLSAYLLFTSETQSNVLINYGHDLNLTGPGAKVASVIVEHVVKVGYALAISFTFPLIQVAVKENVFELLGWGSIMEMSNLRYYGVTLLLLSVEYATAIAVPDISVAFAILGSTVAILIAFILPAMVGMWGSDMKRQGQFLFGAGCVIGCSCLGATVYVLSTGSGGAAHG